MVDILTHHRLDPLYWSPTEAVLRELARTFDMFHANGAPDVIGPWANVIKDENPALLMGFYKHSSLMSDGTWGFGFTGDMAPYEKPYWFLKDINGVIVTQPDVPHLRFLDIGHPEVQAMWANSCMKAFGPYPFDWVKADTLKVNAPWIGTARGSFPVNPRTGIPYTHEEWADDTIAFVRTVKSIIGVKLFLGNMGGGGSQLTTPPAPTGTKSRYDRVMNEIDGAEIEGAIRWEYPREATWRTEAEWVQDLLLIRELCLKGKLTLVYCLTRDLAPEQTVQQVMDYGLASFLLAKENAKAIICLRDGAVPPPLPSTEFYPNLFKGKVGDPVGDSYKRADGVYVRDFSTATVYVNPSSDVRGGMEPHTGLIAIEVPPQYTLDISATAGGTTDPPPGSYALNSGETVQVTGTPDVNYRFVEWQLDGAVRTENPINITMDKDYSLLAVFEYVPVTHLLSVGSSPSGVDFTIEKV